MSGLTKTKQRWVLRCVASLAVCGLEVEPGHAATAQSPRWMARISATGFSDRNPPNAPEVFRAAAQDGSGLVSQDGITWVPQSVSFNTNWRARAEGPHVSVLVDGAGQLRSSTDGSNWVVRDSGCLSALHGIAYGNGRFVAVGNEGALSSSEDGRTWTVATADTDERLRGVAFGNGLFVVVGYNGTALTSRDGRRWNRHASGTKVRLQSVAFGGGTFVAVGWHGVILTSSNGIRWTRQHSGSVHHLHRVAFDERSTDRATSERLPGAGTDVSAPRFIFPVGFFQPRAD